MADRIKGLTIKINGDTTQLSSELKKVNKEIRDTQTALKDVDKLLKIDPGNTELLKQKQELLKRAIEETTDKLKTLKEAQSQMKAEGVEKNSKAYQNLQREITATEQNLKSLEKQANSSAAALQKIGTAGEKIKKAGDSIESAGKKILPVSAAVAGVGVAAVKTAADFDASMSKVAAVSGAAGEDFDKLREKAREMGSKTKFSATEAADAMNYMAMAGWKTEEMLKGIEGIMNLAAASGEDLATTSDIVTDALTALGMKAEDSARLADILAAAASNANTNVSMMGESFKYAAPVAGALGYSAEDVAIALGLMANSGIKASMAGTTLRNMFQRMAKKTKESAEAMDRLGLSLYDSEGNMYSFREIMDQLRASMSNINVPLEEYNAKLDELDANLEDGTITQKKYEDALEELNLQTFGAEGAEKARAAAMLGGARAMSGLLAIANATEADYQKLTEAIDNSSQAFARTKDGVIPLNEALASGAEILETYQGSAEAMAATMQDNLEGQLTILKSQLQELAISLSDLIMPILSSITEKLQDIVTWLNSLDEDTKKVIITIAAIVAAAGPVLIVIGKIVGAVGTLMTVIPKIGGALTGLLATPAGPWILGIAAAIAGLALVIANWDTIVQMFNETKDKLIEKFTQIKDAAVEKFTAMKEKTVAFFDETKDKITEKVNIAKDKAVEAFTKIKDSASEKFDRVKELSTKAMDATKEVVQTRLKSMKEAFEKNGGGIEGTMAATWEGIKGYFTDGFNILDKMTGGRLSELGGIIKEKITGIIDQAKNWGKDMIDGFVQGIKDTIGKVKDTISNVAQTIADYLHFSEPDKGPLSDASSYMPDFMKLLSEGIQENLYRLNQPLEALSNKISTSAQVDVNYNDSALTGKLDTINNSILRGGQTVVKVEMAPSISNLFKALQKEEYRQVKALGGI